MRRDALRTSRRTGQTPASRAGVPEREYERDTSRPRAAQAMKHHSSAAMIEDPDFVEFTMSNILRKRKTAMCRYGGENCHIYPQFEYVWNERGERTCDHVLREPRS